MSKLCSNPRASTPGHAGEADVVWCIVADNSFTCRLTRRRYFRPSWLHGPQNYFTDELLSGLYLFLHMFDVFPLFLLSGNYEFIGGLCWGLRTSVGLSSPWAQQWLQGAEVSRNGLALGRPIAVSGNGPNG